MTPMGSRSGAMEAAAKATGRLLRAHALQRPRDRQHLLIGERLRERVRHPVDGLRGAPGDEPQAGAVVEELVRAPAHAQVLAGVVEDRRRLPARALHAVELALEAGGHDDPVSAIAVAA